MNFLRKSCIYKVINFCCQLFAFDFRKLLGDLNRILNIKD